MIQRFPQSIVLFFIFALLHLGWLSSYAWAEMVPTESLIQPETKTPIQSDRERLLNLLNRERVQKTLNRYGISKAEAMARINSLSVEEIKEISGKMDRQKAGGHDPYGYDDDDDWETELILIILLIGLIAVVYFLGLLVKAVACPFFEDCNTAFVFRPWWIAGPDPEYQYDPPVIVPPEIPVEPPPPIGSIDEGGVFIPGGECDARKQACEWSVR